MTIEEIKAILDDLIEETEIIGKEIYLWGHNEISGKDCCLRQQHRNNLKLEFIEAIKQYGQECASLAKGQKTFKQVLDDNYHGII